MEETGKIRSIAVLTSGGDAPGMNAALRAVVRGAIASNIRVLGIRRGYSGLIRGDAFEMNLRSVSDILSHGGTAIYTARSEEFKTEKGVEKAVYTCKSLGVDAVIVIGGDGSFRGASFLSEHGVPCIGVPGTIDNDIQCSDYTIGFDTAMNTAMDMIDKIRDTTESHDRCSVVEVMGRRCGDLALNTGIAIGATTILVPEIEFDFERDIISKIDFIKHTSKRHFIIIVAEGVGGVSDIAKRIEWETGIASRTTILGHVQRGGSPTVRDRVVASAMGYHAVKLLTEGKRNRIVALRRGKLADFDIKRALKMKKEFDHELYNIAMQISI